MIPAPDPLLLGDKRGNLQLVYETKPNGKNKLHPVWKLNGISDRERRVITDLNFLDIAEVCSANGFDEGFAYVLANPVTDSEQIAQQRRVMSTDASGSLDHIVRTMYDLGNERERLYAGGTDEKRIGRDLRFLATYFNLLMQLKSNFKDSDAEPLESIGSYAAEVLSANEVVHIPAVQGIAPKFLNVTFSMVESLTGGAAHVRLIRADYESPKINPIEMLRNLGHRVRAKWLSHTHTYAGEVEGLVRTLVQDNLPQVEETLSLLSALEFYRAGIRYERQLSGRDHTMLGFSTNGSYIEDFRQPLDALNGAHSVPNTYKVSGDERTILMTGAHDGGKSYFAKSVGVIQSLHQRGLSAPARSGDVETADAIYTHFVAQDDPIKGSGRQTHELRRVAEILDYCGPKSLIIVDEPGGATSPSEGEALSRNLLRAFAETGARVIFGTHYHGLSSLADEHPNIVNVHPDSRVHKGRLIHNYKMLPGPGGSSYAREHAEGMGLGEATLMNKAQAARNR